MCGIAGFLSLGSEPRPDPARLARMVATKGLGTVVDGFILMKKRGHFPQAKLLIAGAMTTGDAAYAESLSRFQLASR